MRESSSPSLSGSKLFSLMQTPASRDLLIGSKRSLRPKRGYEESGDSETKLINVKAPAMMFGLEGRKFPSRNSGPTPSVKHVKYYRLLPCHGITKTVGCSSRPILYSSRDACVQFWEHRVMTVI